MGVLVPAGPIRAMCRCGRPFDPDLTYDATPRRSGPVRDYCTKVCARRWPAKDKRDKAAAVRRRRLELRWRAVGQLSLFDVAVYEAA